MLRTHCKVGATLLLGVSTAVDESDVMVAEILTSNKCLTTLIGRFVPDRGMLNMV